MSAKIESDFKKVCREIKSVYNNNFECLLFSTGIGNNEMFNIDPNIGEFTVDAFRIGMMLYLYHNSTLNFPHELLSTETNTTVFTFADNKFHPQFIECALRYIADGKDFVLSFLPRINSSHWYTLCIQPEKFRVVILNPLSQTSNEEYEFIFNMGFELVRILGFDFEILVENCGLQTSSMSCGENSLMIALAIITNGEDGYDNLRNHFKNDFVIGSILDIYSIAMGRFCHCRKCMGDELGQNNYIIESYRVCLECEKTYGGSIGVNPENAEKCVFCERYLNVYTSEIKQIKKSLNKKKTELNMRNEIINAVRTENIANIPSGCEVNRKQEENEKIELLKQIDAMGVELKLLKERNVQLEQMCNALHESMYSNK